ncbi:DUF6281 family protein [Streptomyces pseudovenezuelae]|uniref:DUF6281 family protein n=1 Tax=Streptomyces pseudovenezuelae TaxID=67350 RepID=UPI002E31FA23|nr:DUF6281 family protein [Streptomyces pseudovenezuelae]WUA88899.1 DUF6281 family protein [Streptomyces pseudovenezuelae]
MTRARLVMTVAVLVAAAGCTADTADGGSAASCAGVVSFEGRRYLPSGRTDFTAGERLGTATVAACDDTPGDGEVAVPEDTTAAYAVEGRDRAEAVAVGDTPAEARLMEVQR